ncbi:MAG TPA: transcription elongation factor GreA [Candidatus Paceibacterota bacterium]|nr:transcription elongation factor GreA [Candidatus Paceibacterota bacterium]
MADQYFSKEGLEKLKQELQQRTDVMRPEIAQRIKEAKEQGDLSENAEFDAAKEAQSMNEGRIEEIKKILENAVVIRDDTPHSGTVTVGSRVKVQSDKHTHEFVIVGVSESDPAAGHISNESPIGKGLLGHKKGDTVKIKTPKGEVGYKIIEVK